MPCILTFYIACNSTKYKPTKSFIEPNHITDILIYLILNLTSIVTFTTRLWLPPYQPKKPWGCEYATLLHSWRHKDLILWQRLFLLLSYIYILCLKEHYNYCKDIEIFSLFIAVASNLIYQSFQMSDTFRISFIYSNLTK